MSQYLRESDPDLYEKFTNSLNLELAREFAAEIRGVHPDTITDEEDQEEFGAPDDAVPCVVMANSLIFVNVTPEEFSGYKHRSDQSQAIVDFRSACRKNGTYLQVRLTEEKHKLIGNRERSVFNWRCPLCLSYMADRIVVTLKDGSELVLKDRWAPV